jgi:outer membrane immunogenic protein
LLTAPTDRGNFMPRHIGLALASALAAGIGALGAACAADLPLKATPLPVAVYNWTSCYGGVNGGWKGGRFGENVSTPGGVATLPGIAPTTFAADSLNLGHLNADSGAAGGQIGCRWETPTHWVFGVEGDFDWTNLNGTIRATTPGTGRSVFIPGDYYNNQARWESSVRGIIGRSFDKWLFYATGGLAIIDVRMQGNFIATTVTALNGLAIPFPASAGGETKPLYGFTIGAGAAYALSKSWDIGAEYRYSQYNGDNFNLGSVAAICTLTACTNTPVTGHKDLTTNEVLFKLNYHFGPTAVVAKY